MIMSSVKWTKEQLQAIKETGSKTLSSARVLEVAKQQSLPKELLEN